MKYFTSRAWVIVTVEPCIVLDSTVEPMPPAVESIASVVSAPYIQIGAASTVRARSHGVRIDDVGEDEIGRHHGRRERLRERDGELLQYTSVVLELIAGYLVAPLGRLGLEVVGARLGRESSPCDRGARRRGSDRLIDAGHEGGDIVERKGSDVLAPVVRRESVRRARLGRACRCRCPGPSSWD